MDKIWLKSYPNWVSEELQPPEYQSIGEMIEVCCNRFGDKKAVTNSGTSLTYNELEAKSRDFAAYLELGIGLKKGDKLAIMLPNCIQYYVALFGALRAGIVVVNVNPLYTKRELIYQLIDAEADSIVVMDFFAHTVEEAAKEVKIKNIVVTSLGELLHFPKGALIDFVLKRFKGMVSPYVLPLAISFSDALKVGVKLHYEPAQINRDDLAFLQYTGGTTGVSKGAMLTHGNILANVAQLSLWENASVRWKDSVMLLPLPIYHIFALTASLVGVSSGSEAILITNPRDLDRMISELQGIQMTVFIGISTLYNALLHHKDFDKIDFSKLKSPITGGMAADPTVMQLWHEKTGVRMIQGYGLTEASPVVTTVTAEAEDRKGTVGFPLPSTEIDIRDDEGNSLPIGESGEICVRGPQVMPGYWRKPEETANVLSEDGWLKTGDIGTVDEDGFLYILERKKDMIIVSGFNVYPREIEEVLMMHPGILEVGVIGIPNEMSGERPKAFIIKKDPSLTKEGIMKFCKEELTNYKCPYEIEFRDELPKSPIGKVLRRHLRDEIPTETEAQKAA